jgi:hypothetical protein
VRALVGFRVRTHFGHDHDMWEDAGLERTRSFQAIKVGSLYVNSGGVGLKC